MKACHTEYFYAYTIQSRRYAYSIMTLTPFSVSSICVGDTGRSSRSAGVAHGAHSLPIWSPGVRAVTVAHLSGPSYGREAVSRELVRRNAADGLEGWPLGMSARATVHCIGGRRARHLRQCALRALRSYGSTVRWCMPRWSESGTVNAAYRCVVAASACCMLHAAAWLAAGWVKKKVQRVSVRRGMRCRCPHSAHRS